MQVGLYRFADINIEIKSLFGGIHEMCRKYVAPIDEKVDFSIAITEGDIEYEHERSKLQRQRDKLPELKFSDAYVETLAVYRKMAEKLLEYDIILFHGSAIAVDGNAFIFTAKSGVGKSTHVRLWRNMLGEKATMVNDDKPLIRIGEDGCMVFGTPWDGKHHLSNNINCPLKAICVIERSEENHIEKIPNADGLPYLLQQSYDPEAPELKIKRLMLLSRLAESTAFYKMYCNMEPEAAEICYSGLCGRDL